MTHHYHVIASSHIVGRVVREHCLGYASYEVILVIYLFRLSLTLTGRCTNVRFTGRVDGCLITATPTAATSTMNWIGQLQPY